MNRISSVFSTKLNIINLDSASFDKQSKEDSNAVLLDVRTPMEHTEARIPNSILIDVYNPNFLKEIDKLDRKKSYYIYCRSGNRSYGAAREMLKMGFEKVFNLKNGIIGWTGEVEQY